jgi:hypothetical protein
MLKIKSCLAFIIYFSCCSYAQTDTSFKPKFFGYKRGNTYSIEHSKALVVASKRKKWIKTAIKSIQQIKIDSTIKASEPHIVNVPEYHKVAYRITDCNTIKFLNGDSVLICLHSVHQDPQVGDVSIAIDSKRKSYVNYGHICGGMINFERMSIIPPIDIVDFIQNFVSDTDKEKWKKW